MEALLSPCGVKYRTAQNVQSNADSLLGWTWSEFFQNENAFCRFYRIFQITEVWVYFIVFLCYLRLPGTVVAFLYPTQEILGSNPTFYENISEILQILQNLIRKNYNSLFWVTPLDERSMKRTKDKLVSLSLTNLSGFQKQYRQYPVLTKDDNVKIWPEVLLLYCIGSCWHL